MKILFFASISEKTGCSSLDLHGIRDTDELMRDLELKYPGIRELNFAIAINKSIFHSNTQLSEADEIALLPPFSGG